VERGAGYPAHRKESQQQSQRTLGQVSEATHRPLAEIIARLPDSVIRPVLEFPGAAAMIDVDSISDEPLRAAFQQRM